MHLRLGTNIAPPEPVIWDVQLNNCGFYKGSSSDIPCSRPNGRIDHHIILVERGQLTVQINGRQYIAHKDEIVYFPPDVPHRYCYAGGADTLYYWLHFSGTKMDALLRLFPFENRVYKLRNLPEYTAVIGDIIQKYSRGKPGTEFFCHAQMQLLLTRMGQEIFGEAGAGKSAALAEKIAAQIRTSPETVPDNALLAEMYGITQYHLIRIFKEKTGCSPQKYRNLMLMEKAKQLLTDTQLNINEISDMLGFSDPLYFSRLFKKTVGVAPSVHRGNTLR